MGLRLTTNSSPNMYLWQARRWPPVGYATLRYLESSTRAIVLVVQQSQLQLPCPLIAPEYELLALYAQWPEAFSH